MAVNDAFAACVAGYGSHSPEVLHLGRFGRSARHRENIADAADLLQDRPVADWGSISVAMYHLRVNTVSQAGMDKLYSLPSEWQRLPVDMIMTVSSFFWP